MALQPNTTSLRSRSPVVSPGHGDMISRHIPPPPPVPILNSAITEDDEKIRISNDTIKLDNLIVQNIDHNVKLQQENISLDVEVL